MQSLTGSPQRDEPQHVAVPMTPSDKWIRALRTGLQLMPFGIGSAIDTGYFGTIDDRRIARLEAFLRKLADDIREIYSSKTDIRDPDTLVAIFGTDEFSYIFEGVLRRVNAEVVQEKLEALRGILLSVIVAGQKMPFEKQASFLKTVDAIEGTHIRILQFLASRSSLADHARYVSRDMICDTLGATSEADVNYVYFALDVLANREFIKSGPIPFTKDGTLDRPKQTFCATALGLEFLEYIRK